MGLEGLGNINLNNASATVESPNSFLAKTDTDSRKIALDSSKFATNDELASYLHDWLLTQCNINTATHSNILSFMLPINGKPISYSVVCVKGESEFTQEAQSERIQSLGSEKVVIFGYYNAPKNNEVASRVKQLGIELFTLTEIYEINSAIDGADKKLPYVSLNQNKLSSMVAKSVNEKYRKQGTMNASTIFGDKQQLSGLGAAFSEGFNQLKNSVTGALGSIKSSTQTINNQQQHIEPQITENNVNTAEQPVIEQPNADNAPHPVKLKKS